MATFSAEHPLELFLASWDMNAIIGKGQDRYNWSWLEVPRRRLTLRPEAVRALLQRNLRSMSASSDQANIAVGLEGIEQLAEDAGAWADYEKPFLKAHLGRCAELLLEIALLREGHGRFLHHVAQICQLPSLNDLSREFESISQGLVCGEEFVLQGDSQGCNNGIAAHSIAAVCPRRTGADCLGGFG